MDKMTKFILAFAAIFLLVTIVIGTSNRPVATKRQPAGLAQSSIAPDKPERKEDKTKSTKEELEVAKDRVSEETSILLEESEEREFPDEDAYSETEFAPAAQFEEEIPFAEKIPDGIDFPDGYPPDYSPENYKEPTEEDIPPEDYPTEEPPEDRL